MRFVSQSVSNPDFCPNLHQIMSPKRPRSEDAEDLPGTDPEMLPLEPVAWVPKQKARMSWSPITSSQAVVGALGDLTVEGLCDLAEYQPEVMKSLNRAMHSRHGVWISPHRDKVNGSLALAVFENDPAIKRKCKWDGQCWTLN